MAIRPYPLADANNNPIPFELINPKASMVLHATTVPMATPIEMSVNTGIVQLTAIEGYALVAFEGRIASVAAGPGIEMPDSILLTPNVVHNVAIFSPFISAIGLNVNVTILVNICSTWNAIGVQRQYRTV